MNSPYFFASITDEYARRGERVLFCGSPPPDMSTCASEIEVPEEYPAGWWRMYVAAIAATDAICAVLTHFS